MEDFTITVDGGSLGNGMEDSIGYGSYIIDMVNGNYESKPFKLQFGTGITSNEAEYLALLAAMKKVIDVIEAVGNGVEETSILVITDSALVVGQCAMGWKIKARNLWPLWQEAMQLISRFYRVTFNRISGDEMKLILGH